MTDDDTKLLPRPLSVAMDDFMKNLANGELNLAGLCLEEMHPRQPKCFLPYAWGCHVSVVPEFANASQIVYADALSSYQDKLSVCGDGVPISLKRLCWLVAKTNPVFVDRSGVYHDNKFVDRVWERLSWLDAAGEWEKIRDVIVAVMNAKIVKLSFRDTRIPKVFPELCQQYQKMSDEVWAADAA